MVKNQINVLIVEDDVSLAKGMARAITKGGFNSLLAHTPAEAMATHRLQLIHAFVIDCLLPKKSGLDLAMELRNAGAEETAIILTSGVFRDKLFLKEAVEKTKAIAFFPKPCEVEKIIGKLDEHFKDSIDEPMEPMQEILTNAQASPQEKLKAVKETRSIHGLELPRVLSLMMNPGLTGKLSISGEDKSAVLHFFNGKIVRAETDDPQSFFGILLVERNFISHSNLEMVLSKEETTGKKIGERLVDANLVSPHAIDIVQADQIAMRLSQLVRETNYDMHFEECVVKDNNAFVDRAKIVPFFSAWIASKVPLSWLQSFYLPWMDHKPLRTEKFRMDHPILNMPPISKSPQVVKAILSGSPLDRITQDHPDKIGLIFSSLHLLILEGLIVFSKAASKIDHTVHLNRLKRIRGETEGKNDFEILGLSRRSKSNQIKKAYHDLSKTFHPDRLDASTPEEIIGLTRDIFQRMTAAYNNLNDDKKRIAYLSELEEGRTEMLLKGESILEEGKKYLDLGQAGKAGAKFDEACSLMPPTSELILYKLWAAMAGIASSRDPTEVIRGVEENLAKVPPEERHQPLYFVVKGILLRHGGQMDASVKSLKHALNLDPRFPQAKRELNISQLNLKGKPVDFLNADISQVVGALFRRK